MTVASMSSSFGNTVRRSNMTVLPSILETTGLFTFLIFDAKFSGFFPLILIHTDFIVSPGKLPPPIVDSVSIISIE